MTSLFRYAVAALICLSAPVVAQTSAPDTPAAKKAPNPNKVICRDEQETGSLLASHRECHTVSEWKELQRQQRPDIGRAQANVGH
jgi:hypothetical protein